MQILNVWCNRKSFRGQFLLCLLWQSKLNELLCSFFCLPLRLFLSLKLGLLFCFLLSLPLLPFFI